MGELDTLKNDHVKLYPLKVISDERGAVLKWIDTSSPFFENFGEAYFSKILPGVTKEWKLHKRFSQNLVVVSGIVRFGCATIDRVSGKCSDLIEYRLDSENHKLLSIEKSVWYCFRCESVDSPAIIANLTNGRYDETEIDRNPPECIRSLVFNS